MAQNISVKGAAELDRKLRKLGPIVAESCRRAVAAEVKATAADERRGAPRRTGTLAQSVTSEIDGDGMSGRVYPTADYARYVNDGARGVPAQPFATAAAKRARRRFPKRVTREISKALAKLAGS